jgi:hypothetical protein
VADLDDPGKSPRGLHRRGRSLRHDHTRTPPTDRP